MKLLLDCCCGPCATHCIEILKNEYEVILFSSNYNIHPKEEYEKRLASLKKLAEIYDLPLIILEYRPNEWFDAIKGHENDKEGGERCKICFKFRLKKAAEWAANHNIPIFTTTLTISPHKKSSDIIEIGEQLALIYNIKFLNKDFKKKDGFKKSVELSKKYSLYRQNYCGCIFSKNH
ncbi:MAG: epoxyqueuosine reductase QueH [Candidatus Helarchaeota archaeon]